MEIHASKPKYRQTGGYVPKFIRFPEVQEKIGGLSRTTVWRLEKKGLFPKRRKLTSRAVAWVKAEVDAWVQARNIGNDLPPGTQKAEIDANQDKQMEAPVSKNKRSNLIDKSRKPAGNLRRVRKRSTSN
jgi:prophage regulatory protein